MKMEKGCIEEYKATKELCQLIPVENIAYYCWIYHGIKEMELYSREDDGPQYKLSRITKELQKLKRQEWVNDNNFKDILLKLFSSMSIDKLLKLSFSEMLKKGRPVPHNKKRRSRKKDWALNFLVYALIFDLKSYTKKPHYDLVFNFLKNLGIIPDDQDRVTSDHLRKRFQRLKINDIFLILDANSVLNNKTPVSPPGIDGFYAGFLYEYLQKGKLQINKRLQEESFNSSRL
ncbi:MAG: hypothetical protein NTU69_12805 [Proteobacteria bacterium]|jgi:hypothetical protein|nr:hypothetical protein [Pseudomonadota bacterium]